MEYEIGMKVSFGRPNGEKTEGIIVKINPKSLKVRTLESRGRTGRSVQGTVWKVPRDERYAKVIQ